jgi:hypothetical protein
MGKITKNVFEKLIIEDEKLTKLSLNDNNEFSSIENIEEKDKDLLFNLYDGLPEISSSFKDCKLITEENKNRKINN